MKREEDEEERGKKVEISNEKREGGREGKDRTDLRGRESQGSVPECEIFVLRRVRSLACSFDRSRETRCKRRHISDISGLRMERRQRDDVTHLASISQRSVSSEEMSLYVRGCIFSYLWPRKPLDPR